MKSSCYDGPAVEVNVINSHVQHHEDLANGIKLLLEQIMDSMSAGTLHALSTTKMKLYKLVNAHRKLPINAYKNN